MSSSESSSQSGDDQLDEQSVEFTGRDDPEFATAFTTSPSLPADATHRTTTPSEEGHKPPPHHTPEQKERLKAHVEHSTINRTPLWIAGLSLIAASLIMTR